MDHLTLLLEFWGFANLQCQSLVYSSHLICLPQKFGMHFFCISYFYHHCDQISNKINLRNEGLIWAHILNDTVHQGGQDI